jgi:hypothetical protein
MPKAEITPSTGYQHARGRDPQFEAVVVLRQLARSTAELAADPSAAPHPDHELLGLCDQIATLRWQAAEALAAWNAAPVQSQAYRDAQDDIKRTARGLRGPMRRAGILRATTAAGLYAKAIAVSKATDSALGLGKSLAQDLLACTELRAVLWPAATPGEG